MLCEGDRQIQQHYIMFSTISMGTKHPSVADILMKVSDNVGSYFPSKTFFSF